jgi:hypothetical protein
VWSLIRNKKKQTIFLFERNCHVTVKSEAIACARRCRPSPVNKLVDPKRIIRKNGGPRRRRGIRGRCPKK